MYFLFTDSEVFHSELESKTWRAALAEVRDWYRIKGRLRIVEVTGGWGSESREYKLDGTTYRFSLKKVDG